MTQAEWLTSSSEYDLYQFIRVRTSRRKLRLYACACCREVWPLLVEQSSREAVEASERYADGLISKAALSAAQGRASKAFESTLADWSPLYQTIHWGLDDVPAEEQAAVRESYYVAARRKDAARAAKAASRSTDRDKRMAEQMCLASRCSLIAQFIGRTIPANQERLAKRASLLRCIVGNPFSSVIREYEPMTPDVVWLAQDVYEERAFNRLPELADALEGVGCTDREILEHCRRAGPHARGCWVVDLLLGKQLVT